MKDFAWNCSSLSGVLPWLVCGWFQTGELYAKLEKCEFGVTEVDFLGHRITQEGLKMDDHKNDENIVSIETRNWEHIFNFSSDRENS